MLFNSYAFIFAFLPLAVMGFIILSRSSMEKAIAWLVLTSLFFYGWWNPVYLVLIIGSMLFNYATGRHISHVQPHKKQAKIFLILGIVANLALLGYFNILISCWTACLMCWRQILPCTKSSCRWLFPFSPFSRLPS